MDDEEPPTVAGLFAMAHGSDAAAIAAGKKAADAVAAAMRADDLLTTTATAGDSTKAMMYAQAILNAKTHTEEAVTEAEKALADAEEAKTKADAMLAEDMENETLIALVAALEAAIEEAQDQIKAAKAHRDGDDLKASVTAVTGGEDADPQGTPRSIANAVGMAISGALSPTSQTNGSATRVTHGSAAPADTIRADHKVEMHNRVGQTWAMLVGESNLMAEERLGIVVASVAGMTATMVDTDVTDDGGIGGTSKYADLFTSDTSLYKGIPGDIYCLGTDCEVDTEGKLAGSWYFKPTSPMEYYVENPDEATAETTPYVAETLFATFGHWLTEAGGEWTVNTYSAADGALTGFDVTTVNETGDLSDESATYSGTAAGMSVRTMGTGDDRTVDSGRFTADVTLTATFDATAPMIEGTIDDFEGSAVNGSWTVTLQKSAFTAGALAATTGRTTAGGREGTWSANAYGNSGTARPAGIHGGFNAHFSDGHAAGAYATRKQATTE